ncbi:MAG TPA: hypothetical protein VHZ99_06265 [Steroidobacteraceae bacterium]|jgi:hypothetical protein|nr:hypothetical protein [Steroidobacteraceae bacterium]
MSNATQDTEQRRRVRRSAVIFGLVAFSFYLLFIVYAVTHGHK